jgi:choline-sulfatase
MRRLAVAAFLAALAAAGWWTLRPGEFRLPARIAVEEVVADLSAHVDPADVVAQAPGDPVRAGGVQPGLALELDGGWRQALLAPPPSRVRFRAAIPDGAALRFGIAVEGGEAARHDAGVGGVRFAVEVDGREVFARTLDPAHTKRDRRWVDATVTVPDGDGAREVVLRTEVVNGRAPGAAGWSHVRVVRSTTRERQVASAAAPSVLVLLVDTLRADVLGAYGAHPSMTPTVDALAARGLVVEEMVSASSWTMPSVATLMTGLYPPSHGVLGRPEEESPDAGPDPSFLSDSLPTLPVLAQVAGITTVAVSANPIVSRATNFARGFETFVEHGWDRRTKNWLPARDVNATFVRWLRANRGRRFLGYLHYMEPHDPYTPPAATRPPPPPGVRPAIAAGDVVGVSSRLRRGKGGLLSDAELAYVRALYGLEVRDWDDALGSLLAALDGLGVRDSTVIVVVGDHGEEFQEHGYLKHGIHLYEELLHVPFVVAGPGIASGRRAGQAQGVDLFPTLAALLGVAPPAGLPGQDLRAPREPRPAFSTTRYGIAGGRHAELVSVRAGGWKLIQAPAIGVTEVYDLREDPGERRNLAGAAPEGNRLAALVAEWQHAIPPPPPVAGEDPRLREKLRALGYVD